jgi:hypothetical protein
MPKNLSKPNFFLVSIDIYQMDILVSYNQTDEQFFNSIKKFKLSDEEINECLNIPTSVRARVFSIESKGMILRLKEVKDVKGLSIILAHEIFHLTTIIMDRIGDRLKIGTNDEAYAYLNEHITTLILNKLL